MPSSKVLSGGEKTAIPQDLIVAILGILDAKVIAHEQAAKASCDGTGHLNPAAAMARRARGGTRKKPFEVISMGGAKGLVIETISQALDRVAGEVLKELDLREGAQLRCDRLEAS